MASSPPHNFSWVDQGKLAGLALPRMASEYQYLLDHGIKHLVCLCERKPPNYDTCPDLKLHHIKITDFTPPSPSQIERFLGIVEEANTQGEVSVSAFYCGECFPRLSWLAFHREDVFFSSPGRGGSLHARPRQNRDHVGLLPGEDPADFRRGRYRKDSPNEKRLDRDSGPGESRGPVLPTHKVTSDFMPLSDHTFGNY